MWTQSFLIWGGAHNRLCPSLACRLYHRLMWTANARRFVPVPDLAVALVGATSLERPVCTSRWLQPTLNYFRGGFLRQLPSRWREQPHLVAQWCRLLCLAGRHLILPPSNPLHSMKELFILLRAPNPPNEATPSLQPFTFDEGAVRTSWGENAHPFHAQGLPLPPWKQTRRKY
jgi:hypothetical protein